MERIFLIGFMGSGKTTLGKALAQKLGVDFIDLDLYIETRYHKTVREIFAESGEERFRQIEKSLLHEVADFENVIIAAGGGTPCFFDNIDYMNGHGTCVYLKASVEELCKRLAGGRESRPLLRGKSDEELRLFIDQSIAQRETYYTRASLHFDTGSLTTRKEIDDTVIRLQQLLHDTHILIRASQDHPPQSKRKISFPEELVVLITFFYFLCGFKRNLFIKYPFLLSNSR